MGCKNNMVSVKVLSGDKYENSQKFVCISEK